MKRHRLGSWQMPSGGDVIAFLEPRQVDRVRNVVLEWSAPPPLCREDLLHYLVVVRPAVTCLVAEYLELPGPRLTIEVCT